jgi:hypothetical protein
MTELPSCLFARWVNSHEEDEADLKVYRPYGTKFPPARGRTGFEIRPNGEFVQYGIAPTDGSRQVMGHWEIVDANTFQVTFGDPQRQPLLFTIVACDEEKLLIRRSTTS